MVYISDMSTKKLAVFLPGIGYHKDKPLLYYAAKMAVSKDYEVIHVEYHDLPQKVKGDPSKMQAAAEIAFSQMEEQLKDVDFSAYGEALFVGKSIGTYLAALYVSKHELDARQIWYTPLEATFSFDSKDVLAFIGDADPWSDVDRVKQIAKKMEIPLYSYEGVNHSLECEDVIRNIRVLEDVMEKMEEFLPHDEY